MIGCHRHFLIIRSAHNWVGLRHFSFTQDSCQHIRPNEGTYCDRCTKKTDIKWLPWKETQRNIKPNPSRRKDFPLKSGSNLLWLDANNECTNMWCKICQLHHI